MTGAPEEEEARDEDDEEDRDEGMTMSGEKIDGPDKDVEQDNDFFDGDKDVNRDAVRGGGGY